MCTIPVQSMPDAFACYEAKALCSSTILCWQHGIDTIADFMYVIFTTAILNLTSRYYGRGLRACVEAVGSIGPVL